MVNLTFHTQWFYANTLTIKHSYKTFFKVTITSNKERKELRYQRRCKNRQNKKNNDTLKYNDFDYVFSYEHLYYSYKKCRKGVSWKKSTQKFITQAPLLIKQIYDKLHKGTFKSNGFYEFYIYERGKIRHIRSVTMAERVVQRCLCDYSLVPMLKRSFIYDNGATLENKGYKFSLDRLTYHLQEHYREHGNDGYILLCDFSKFFDNISHDVLREIIDDTYTDQRIIKLINHFIDCFGDIGLGLGSQVSQILALSSANRLDHMIKEKYHIRGYGRYMDDEYCIHIDKNYLKECLLDMENLCNELGIKLNKKKTKIVKLSHVFTFLKARINLSNDGKVIKRINKRSITNERQKLKKLEKALKENKIQYEDVYSGWKSWESYANNFSSRNTVQNMSKLYNKLFIEPFYNGGVLCQS